MSLEQQIQLIEEDPELPRAARAPIQKAFVAAHGGSYTPFEELARDVVISTTGTASTQGYFASALLHETSMEVAIDSYVRDLNDTALEVFDAGVEVEASRSVREGWLIRKLYDTTEGAHLFGRVAAADRPAGLPEGLA